MSKNTSKKERLVEKFNEMFPFDWELLRVAGAEPVPHHLKKWWFCLGGTVFFLFFIQLITGLALTFYYIPYPDQAYGSVATITQEVQFGWFIRSLHKWAANFMIIAVFLHMFRVFFTGAYRHPRQLNWMIGVILLGITLGFGFTGYSLVYEQLSFWGATVACNLAGAVPFIGDWLGYFLRGGATIGENTLTRFYIFHIALLPAATIILLSLDILLIRLHGVTELYFEGEVVKEEEKFFRFIPEHITTELMVGIFLIYLLTIFALIFPAGLGEPANPTVTPAHIKPEWYFYANFRLLKLTSLKISVVFTMILGAITFFWPFVEEWLENKLNISREISIPLGIVGFACFIILTVWESLAI